VKEHLSLNTIPGLNHWRLSLVEQSRSKGMSYWCDMTSSVCWRESRLLTYQNEQLVLNKYSLQRRDWSLRPLALFVCLQIEPDTSSTCVMQSLPSRPWFLSEFQRSLARILRVCTKDKGLSNYILRCGVYYMMSG
jgi:hypothetical protein